MVSCWLEFLNISGATWRMLAGDMSLLMDLRRRANVFCSYAKGFTQFWIYFSMNSLYLP